MHMKPLIISVIILAVLAAASLVAGFYVCKFALCPEEHGQMIEADRAKWEDRVPGINGWYDSLHAQGLIKDTVVVRENGLKYHAVYASAPAPDSAAATAVLVHGYTDNFFCMMHIARIYRDSLNCNVLIFDQHHHGMSEGDAIQMGWLDRFVARDWIDAAHNIWSDRKVIVHGVSMGGATVMMLSGETLPPYVAGLVEDCGYTSVWKQFAKELREGYHLPAFPVLNCASLICRIKYGWGFKEASSTAQLAKSTLPMLFIHGDSDTYVPTSEVYENYEAKTVGFKDLWLVPDTAHAASCQNRPAEYTEHLRQFLKLVIQ